MEQHAQQAMAVFEASDWLGKLWNSCARAVSREFIEWQCNTWGSGRGCGDWMDSALFAVVSEALDLPVSRNWDARDELIVQIPLGVFPRVKRMIERLGDNPEDWPWFDEDVEDPIAVAAEVLEMTREGVAETRQLLDKLRLV